MKANSLILLFLFCLILQPVFSQNTKLIENRDISDAESRTQLILQKSPAYISVDFIRINIDKIIDNEQFILEFGDRMIEVQKERIDVRGINNFTFVGKNFENGNSIVLSVFDDDMQGVIETLEAVYAIETIENAEYAVIRVDQSKLHEDCGHTEEEETDSEVLDTDIASSPADTVASVLRSSTSVSYDCKIRVLVLYTPAAQSAVSNIKNTVQLAVSLSNQSFINSNVNHEIELAYAGLTNYTESGSITTDRNRFRNSGDGYMDEVLTLRNKYSADICVLLNYTSEACGIAYSIGAIESNGFCVVSTYSNCATSNYSFVHEIGHLMGCRHDTYVDPNNTPYAYGHGYVYSPDLWRTIMAYSNACNSCTRKNYWSNPNVTYNGVPMGTSSTNNNAQVWNVRSNTVMAFRQPASDVTFTSSDIPNTHYVDVIAKQNIETSGTVNVASGNTVNMRAGNSITLKPEFTAALGSSFNAGIENVYDCGGSSSLAPPIVIEENNDDYSGIESNFSSSVAVFPNPANDWIHINYSLSTNSSVSIELVNFLGRNFKSVLSVLNQAAGEYSVPLSVSDLTSGVYFLIVTINGQKQIKKIVIN